DIGRSRKCEVRPAALSVAQTAGAGLHLTPRMPLPIRAWPTLTRHCMQRFFLSLLIALIIGVLLGLYLGWVQFPVEYIDSPASALDQPYQDEYTVMIAAGYSADQDLTGALTRLRVLGVENVPTYV